MKLATDAESLWANRCTSASRTCEDCMYNSCSKVLPEFECVPRWKTSSCADCFEPGRKLSADHAVFKLKSPSSLISTDVKEMLFIIIELKKKIFK